MGKHRYRGQNYWPAEANVTCGIPGMKTAMHGEAGMQGLIYLQAPLQLYSLALLLMQCQQRIVSLACDVVTCPDISKKIIKSSDHCV